MALGAARGAMPASVVNQLMAELNPSRLRQELYQLAFNLDGVRLSREVETL